MSGPEDMRGRYRHARFMPRHFSRLALELTDVRVERLHAISEADAIAEGISLTAAAIGVRTTSDTPEPVAVAMYRALWETIYGEGSWALNPWLWVLTFHRVPSIAGFQSPRSIPFSTPMVLATLADRKSQTRRTNGLAPFNVTPDRWTFAQSPIHPGIWDVTAGDEAHAIKCPYGWAGRGLVGREAWRAPKAYDGVPPRAIPAGTPITYEADAA